MIFQKKIDQMFAKLHEEKEEDNAREKERLEKTGLSTEMEKGDLTAMILSALLVIVPAALVALLLLCGIGAWFFLR